MEDNTARYLIVGQFAIVVSPEAVDLVEAFLDEGTRTGIPLGLNGCAIPFTCISAACKDEWMWIPRGAPVIVAGTLPDGITLLR